MAYRLTSKPLFPSSSEAQQSDLDEISNALLEISNNPRTTKYPHIDLPDTVFPASTRIIFTLKRRAVEVANRKFKVLYEIDDLTQQITVVEIIDLSQSKINALKKVVRSALAFYPTGKQ